MLRYSNLQILHPTADVGSVAQCVVTSTFHLITVTWQYGMCTFLFSINFFSVHKFVFTQYNFSFVLHILNSRM